jgi:stage IV sporulation protein FB
VFPAFRTRIAGFPVQIEVTFFLLAGILGQGRPGNLLLAWIGVVFVSILAHELGHAVAFRAYGDTPRITLHAFGGVTQATKELPLGKGVVATLAGPLTGLLLLGLPAYAIRASAGPPDIDWFTWWVVLSDLVWVNVGWSVLNLLPILPLDGGLIARRLLTHALGRRGDRAALLVSMATAGGGAAFAFFHDMPFLGFYALYFAGNDGIALYRSRDDRHRDRIREAWKLSEEGERRRAEEILRETLAAARTPAVRTEAAGTLAWSLLVDGRFSEARRIVDGPASDAEIASIVDGVLKVIEGSVAEGSASVARWWLAHPKHSLGEMVVGHLVRSGAIPHVADHLLAAQSDDAAVLVAGLQWELHLGRHFVLSAEVGRSLFEDGRVPPAGVAYNVACSLSRDGHLGQALDWLDRAVQSGWTDDRQILSDEDLITLQDLPRFRVILDRIPR